jgi:hypothetical protein
LLSARGSEFQRVDIVVSNSALILLSLRRLTVNSPSVPKKISSSSFSLVQPVYQDKHLRSFAIWKISYLIAEIDDWGKSLSGIISSALVLNL